MTDQMLTERQQYWLEHLQRCEASGEPLKSYADAHSLSVHSLYEAKRRLKRRGVFAEERAPAAKFVQVARVQSTAPMCRVQFANGAWVELEVGADELDRVLRSVAALR